MPVLTPETLAEHSVGSDVVGGVYYVPEYIGVEEERSLLEKVGSAKVKWKELSGRRLQMWGGEPREKGMMLEKLPDWLVGLLGRLRQDTSLYGEEALNHVLVNEYRPGEGIMPHEDGPLYHPVVCIVSMGAPVVMKFRPKPAPGEPAGEAVMSLALMPRSLLVFTREAYTAYMHGIDEVEEHTVDPTLANSGAADVAKAGVKVGGVVKREGRTRVSFTCRRVLKTRKSLIKL